MVARGAGAFFGGMGDGLMAGQDRRDRVEDRALRARELDILERHVAAGYTQLPDGATDGPRVAGHTWAGSPPAPARAPARGANGQTAFSGDWLTYSNQSATRNQPVADPLVQAMSFLPDMGLRMEVFSGGQPVAGQGPRVGSVRHDEGNAADVFFYTSDGRRLDWSNPNDVPVYQEIVRRARDNGLTGFGAGPGYMQPGSMHIGYGAPAVWGANGRSANAPQWLRDAYRNVDTATLEATVTGFLTN